MKRGLLFTGLFAGVMLWSGPGAAEGVLAIGFAPGGPTHGWVYGWAEGADAPTRALDLCRGVIKENNAIPVNASASQKACAVVATLRNQCMAISSNGSLTRSPTGFGWVIAADLTTATEQAVAMCKATAGAGAPPCVVRGSACDGTAK